VLVTQKLCAGLPSLRRPSEVAVIWDCLAAGGERHGMRVVQISVQTDHIHR
jgi:hypothetical protein